MARGQTKAEKEREGEREGGREGGRGRHIPLITLNKHP